MYNQTNLAVAEEQDIVFRFPDVDASADFSKEDMEDDIDGLHLSFPRAKIAGAAFPVLPGPGRETRWETVEFEPNTIGAETLQLESTASSCRLILRRNGGEEILEAGFGRRIDNHTRFGCSCLRRMAASAAWRDDETLEVLAHLYETPYRLRFLLRRENGVLTLERNANLLFFGLEEWPLLCGRLSRA